MPRNPLRLFLRCRSWLGWLSLVRLRCCISNPPQVMSMLWSENSAWRRGYPTCLPSPLSLPARCLYFPAETHSEGSVPTLTCFFVLCNSLSFSGPQFTHLRNGESGVADLWDLPLSNSKGYSPSPDITVRALRPKLSFPFIPQSFHRYMIRKHRVSQGAHSAATGESCILKEKHPWKWTWAPAATCLVIMMYINFFSKRNSFNKNLKLIHPLKEQRVQKGGEWQKYCICKYLACRQPPGSSLRGGVSGLGWYLTCPGYSLQFWFPVCFPAVLNGGQKQNISANAWADPSAYLK